MTVATLPAALAPWAAWLGLFPEAHARTLGPLVQRLAAAIGPLALPTVAAEGEPDGFGGLDRRGGYERLLISEWLLAEVAPDEFMRRAAMGEHAFLRVERRAPARARTCVALFDVGPTQLGSPRIAHIAALIALLRRADAGGASLAWGALQRPDEPLERAAIPASVKALLARRSAAVVAERELDAWRARAEQDGWTDVWIVGQPAALASRWPRVGSVEVREPIAADVRELIATVRGADGRVARTRLPLPDGPGCVRLIRDPFPAAPTAVAGARVTTRRVPVTNLVISACGEQVFAGARGGGVIAYPIPHSASGGVGRPKLHFSEKGQAPAAVGWLHRGPAALIVDGDVALLQRRVSRRSSHRRTTTHRPFAAGGELRPLVFRGERTLVVDGEVRLLDLGPPATAESEAHTNFVMSGTVALAGGPGWVAFVACRDDTELALQRLHIEAEGKPPFVQVVGIAADGVFFAHGLGGHCLAAIGVAERWTIHSVAGTVAELTVPGEVVGFVASTKPALIVLDPGRRSFTLHDADGPRRLLTTAEPVRHATVAVVSGHLAYLTESGTVVVLRPPYVAPLASFVAEDR